MKKNVASQVVGAQMVSASDGSAFTGTATVVVTVDGGTQSASGGTGPTHEGNGFHTYLPTQAETNGDHVAFTFTGTGAIPVTVQVYTTFPQTGDSFARLGAPAGASVSADIATVDSNVDAILVDTGTTLPGVLGTPTDFGSGTSTLAANLQDMADNGTATFDRSTDSLQALRDRGDAAWITATGFSTHTAANVRTEMDSNSTQLAAIVADTNELQTDWADGGRLDLILDARASQTTADAIETDTQDIQGRLPAALVSGRMSSDAVAISGNTTAANNLEASALGIISGTAQTGTLSTTVMTTDLTGYADDELIGRTVVWTGGTAAGQASDITDYANASGTVTYTAITTAPANGDTFVIV